MLRVVLTLLFTLLVPVATLGQIGLAFEFSFSNPGARSMGFGGAFAALADDATAAFANPAGLVQLTAPEVSLEVRNWQRSVPFTSTGRLTGAPTRIGLDTKWGIERGYYDNDVTGLSFLSFVYPRERWSIAVYRHVLADFETRAETQGLFAEGPGPVNTYRFFDRRDTSKLETVTYGLAGAFEVLDNLSLGLGLTYFDGQLEGNQLHYRWDEDSLEGYFGPTSFLPEKFVSGAEFTTTGSDIGFSVGLLWRVVENWSLGGFYRRGPEFGFDYSLTGGPASNEPELPPGTVVTQSTSIKFPNVYGAGTAFRSVGGRLTLSYEWDHVEYSSIFASLGATSSGEFIADADEHHLGAEYALLKIRPILALRAGMWLNPNHQVRSEDLDDQVVQGLLGTGGAEMHFSFGIGAAFQRFQIDLGVDLADSQNTLSISGIYSW